MPTPGREKHLETTTRTMKKLRGQETIICHMVLQIFDAIGLGAILFIILYKIVGSEAALYVCFAITLLIRLFSEKKIFI